MEPEEALTAYLMATTSLTALIGQRWYPLLIPQDAARPACAYQRLPDTQRVLAHDGPTHFATTTIQVTAQADDYAHYGQVKQIMRIIRQTLEGYRGTMGGVGGLKVFRIAVHSDGDGWAEQLSMPTLRMDIEINYQEA